ncbi:UNVERIFIED_CONTAM: hypothetical protein Sindi_0129900 [Sesamum indicum]
MEFYAKLLQHRYFLAAAIAVSLSLVAVLSTPMPSLTSILFYFWPLFLSTALVLAAIIVIGQISPIPPEFFGYKESEALLDYVAGQPASALENY